jgi:hypothetical protein
VVQMISGYYSASRVQSTIAESLSTGNITQVWRLWKLLNDYYFQVNVTVGGNAQHKLSEVEREVCERKVPVIVLQRLTIDDMKYGHYRIVVGSDGNTIYVMDPIVELSSFSREEFLMLWRKNAEVESDNVAIVSNPE